MTVLESIQKSTEYLSGKGVDSPRLTSELLLAGILGTERLPLYLDFGRVLSEEEVKGFRQMVKRRGEREPLQHILGSACFCGYEVEVSRDVLVPRPETELLAEEGWKFLNGLGGPGFFVDFGTGSGCIAIALAQRAKEARGIGVDVSAAAVAVARRNVQAQKLEERVAVAVAESLGQVKEGLPAEGADLLISNPPYIASAEIATLQEEVRDFDPRQALDGGSDGLDYYRLLAREGAGLLSARGKLLAEFGDGQAGAATAIFEGQKWIVEKVLPDYNGKPRILSARRAGS